MEVIPEAAIEALARVLADEALFDADCSGSGWDAETDSSDHFMPRARKRATEYLEAAAPHMLAGASGQLRDWYEERMNEEHATDVALTEYEQGREVGITEGILAAALKVATK